MVRKGFDLAQRRRDPSQGPPEERASCFAFVLPSVAVLLLFADVISICIVCADFFARGDAAWFGISIATLGAVAIISSILDVQETGQWLRLPLYVLLNLVYFPFFESLYVAATSAMVDPALSRSERRKLLEYKARQAMYQAFPQVILQTFVILYLYCTYFAGAAGSRQSASQAQVAALSTGLCSTLFSLCLTRWDLERYGPRVLADVLGEHFVVRFVFVCLTFLWSVFEVGARVAALVLFAIAYQGWVAVALGGEYAVRILLLASFVLWGTKGSSSATPLWLRALRQIFVHEVDVEVEDTTMMRAVFLLFTLFTQGVYVTLPLIDDTVTQINPSGTALAPGPIISGLCVLTDYRTTVARIFQDISSSRCDGRMPALLPVVAVACTCAALFFYVSWQLVDTWYTNQAQLLMPHAYSTQESSPPPGFLPSNRRSSLQFASVFAGHTIQNLELDDTSAPPAVPKLFQQSHVSTAAAILSQPQPMPPSPAHAYYVQSQQPSASPRGMVAFDSKGTEYSLVQVVPTPRGLVPVQPQFQSTQSFPVNYAGNTVPDSVQFVPQPQIQQPYVLAPAPASWPPSARRTTARPLGATTLTTSGDQLLQVPGTGGVFVQQPASPPPPLGQQGQLQGSLVHKASFSPGALAFQQQYQQQQSTLVHRGSFSPGAGAAIQPASSGTLPRHASFGGGGKLGPPGATYATAYGGDSDVRGAEPPALFRTGSRAQMLSPPNIRHAVAAPTGRHRLSQAGGTPMTVTTPTAASGPLQRPAPSTVGAVGTLLQRGAMPRRTSSVAQQKAGGPLRHRSSAAVALQEQREEVALGLSAPGPRRPAIPGLLGSAY